MAGWLAPRYAAGGVCGEVVAPRAPVERPLRRMAYLSLSEELVLDLLRGAGLEIGGDVRVGDARINRFSGQVDLCLEGEQFPVVTEGAEATQWSPVLSQIYDPRQLNQDEILAALNRNQHRNYAWWHVDRDGDYAKGNEEHIRPDEAAMIAEWYVNHGR